MDGLEVLDVASLNYLSKEQSVYQQLRRAITSGALKPGQRLIPAEVAKRFLVSSMPVRNALMRLEAERLITRAPHREYVVTPYSKKRIKDLYAIRAVLEGYGARLAAQNTTPELLDRLRDILRRSEEHLARGDIDALVAANWEFHSTVCRQSGNEQLLEIVQLLRDRASWVMQKEPAETVREHWEVLRALERGDGDAVEALVRADLESTGVAQSRSMEPEADAEP